jgi:hypothetical protein
MSDITDLINHSWVREHAETYVADGLSIDESLRLEDHLRDCAPCAAAVDEARRLDRGLNSLFAPIRPGADLEDRAVLKLRAGRPRGLRLQGWPRRALIAATVLIALGGTGALVGRGDLPVPGEIRRAMQPWQSVANLNVAPTTESQRLMVDRGGAASDEVSAEKDSKNTELGFNSHLEAARAAQNLRDAQLLT